jgi:hypothetical protein
MKSLLFILSTFLLISISDHTGNWNYSIAGPDGNTYKGVIVLELDGGDYKGEIQSDLGTTKLQDLEIDGNDISFNLDFSGYALQYSGTFEGDVLTALVSVEGMEIPFKATRDSGDSE